MVKMQRPFTGQGPSIRYSHMNLSILKEKFAQTISVPSSSTHPHADGKSSEHFWSSSAKQCRTHNDFSSRTEVDRDSFQIMTETLKNVHTLLVKLARCNEVSRSPQIQINLKGIILTVFKGTLCDFKHINKGII